MKGLPKLIIFSGLIALGIFIFTIIKILQRNEVVITDIQKYTGPIVTTDNPYFGSSNPSVRLILYSNFTCANCGKFTTTVLDTIKDKNVTVIWKDLTNDSLNPLSTKAALAGHCASEQSRFWQYQDLIQAYSGQFSEADLKAAAASLQLNTRQFNRCYDNAKYQYVLDQAADEAHQLNVTAAPTLFIGNDRFATGSVDAAALNDRLKVLLSL